MGNKLSLLGAVAEVIAPGAHDWIVSLWFHDGSFAKRRVSPSRLTEEVALFRVLHSMRRKPSDVRDAEIRRFSDVSVCASVDDAELKSLIERSRSREPSR